MTPTQSLDRDQLASKLNPCRVKVNSMIGLSQDVVSDETLNSDTKKLPLSRKLSSSLLNPLSTLSKPESKPLQAEAINLLSHNGTNNSSLMKNTWMKHRDSVCIQPIEIQPDSIVENTVQVCQVERFGLESGQDKKPMAISPNLKWELRSRNDGEHSRNLSKNDVFSNVNSNPASPSALSPSQNGKRTDLSPFFKDQNSSPYSVKGKIRYKQPGRTPAKTLQRVQFPTQRISPSTTKGGAAVSLDETDDLFSVRSKPTYRASSESNMISLAHKANPSVFTSSSFSTKNHLDGKSPALPISFGDGISFKRLKSLNPNHDAARPVQVAKQPQDTGQSLHPSTVNVPQSGTQKGTKVQNNSSPAATHSSLSSESSSGTIIPIAPSLGTADAFLDHLSDVEKNVEALRSLSVSSDFLTNGRVEAKKKRSTSPLSNSSNVVSFNTPSPSVSSSQRDKLPICVKVNRKFELELTNPTSSRAHSTDCVTPKTIPSRFQHPPIPLCNYGNTCYLNATLQCLLHTPNLLSMLQADLERIRSTTTANKEDADNKESPSGQHTCATEVLIELGLSTDEHSRESLLMRIKDIAAARNEQFSNGQNDAHEFLRTILHEIHEEINRRKGNRGPYEEIKNIPKETEEEALRRWMSHLSSLDDSTVYDFFGGVLRSRCECLNCNNVSLTFDPFLDLSLPVTNVPTTPVIQGKTPKSTKGSEKGKSFQFFNTSKSSRDEKNPRLVTEAVDIILRQSHVAESYEMLSEGNKLCCDKCKKLCNGRRTSNVVRWPRILVLHLKRFDESGKKNDANVVYPNSFMLEGFRYKLYAVCCHTGSESSGHYTSYVSLPANATSTSMTPAWNDSNLSYEDGSRAASCQNVHEPPAERSCGAIQEKWYFCNDTSIAEVDSKNAFSSLSNVYILFYSRR